MLAVAQQIARFYRFGHNRAAGGADTGGSLAGTFLYRHHFHELGIKLKAAVVVENLGVGIGVVHFEIDLVLPHAADVDPLRLAGAAAEADGRFVGQHFFQIGGGAFFQAFDVDAVGGSEAFTFHVDGFQLGRLGIGCMGKTGGQGKRQQA